MIIKNFKQLMMLKVKGIVLDASIYMRVLLLGLLLLFCTSLYASDKNIFEAEKGKPIQGASKIALKSASGGYLISFTKSGDGITFNKLPAAKKLAIKYSSLGVGQINVLVNNQPAQKLNIHSSGDLKSSFLNAIIDIDIPSGAKLTLNLLTNDINVNIDYIIVGNDELGLSPDIWNLPALPIAEGPYKSDWKELSDVYNVPEWWRDAKFGAWSHWDPQSMPEQGDWYARNMYMDRNPVYAFHNKTFGHVSEYGYKDIAHNWVIDKWNPEEMMELFVEMGARYFMAMGVHHDNFDCWDSKYQPWNSVNVGPKVDVVGIWEKIARKQGLRFGIGFHNTPPRTWGQFMPVRYTSDKSGPKEGVPYDALQTIADGKGTWWEGLDPVDLYGPVHTRDDNSLLSPFANQFMWRIDDAINKYHPDIIYFDEHAGDSQVDLGVHMGLGFLAPQLIANYYNKSLKWNNNKMEAVINLKAVGGRWDSFQNSPELLPYVDRSLVKSSEMHIEPEIMAYPFQTETSIAEWHYKTGMAYMDAKKVIQLLMENISRNGTMLLNLTQHGRGDLDPEVIRTAKDIGAWLKVNGEAIYGSRPFEVYGGDGMYYIRNNGFVYAVISDWKDETVTLKALHKNGSTLGNISKVEMLGTNVAMTFVQDENGLTVTPNGKTLPLPNIANEPLALGFRVLRITHDKGWINDDDPGAVAPKWARICNLNSGDYNNDLTISYKQGDAFRIPFKGKSVTVIAPKEKGYGKIDIKIDGKSHGTVDLSTEGMRQSQQVVFKTSDLPSGEHFIEIINNGNAPVAIDALIAEE
jgi:alpha-L-fucosidase